jgi:hypothetical protein
VTRWQIPCTMLRTIVSIGALLSPLAGFDLDAPNVVS